MDSVSGNDYSSLESQAKQVRWHEGTLSMWSARLGINFASMLSKNENEVTRKIVDSTNATFEAFNTGNYRTGIGHLNHMSKEQLAAFSARLNQTGNENLKQKIEDLLSTNEKGKLLGFVEKNDKQTKITVLTDGTTAKDMTKEPLTWGQAQSSDILNLRSVAKSMHGLIGDDAKTNALFIKFQDNLKKSKEADAALQAFAQQISVLSNNQQNNCYHLIIGEDPGEENLAEPIPHSVKTAAAQLYQQLLEAGKDLQQAKITLMSLVSIGSEVSHTELPSVNTSRVSESSSPPQTSSSPPSPLKESEPVTTVDSSTDASRGSISIGGEVRPITATTDESSVSRTVGKLAQEVLTPPPTPSSTSVAKLPEEEVRVDQTTPTIVRAPSETLSEPPPAVKESLPSKLISMEDLSPEARGAIKTLEEALYTELYQQNFSPSTVYTTTRLAIDSATQQQKPFNEQHKDPITTSTNSAFNILKNESERLRDEQGITADFSQLSDQLFDTNIKKIMPKAFTEQGTLDDKNLAEKLALYEIQRFAPSINLKEYRIDQMVAFSKAASGLPYDESLLPEKAKTDASRLYSNLKKSPTPELDTLVLNQLMHERIKQRLLTLNEPESEIIFSQEFMNQIANIAEAVQNSEFEDVTLKYLADRIATGRLRDDGEISNKLENEISFCIHVAQLSKYEANPDLYGTIDKGTRDAMYAKTYALIKTALALLKEDFTSQGLVDYSKAIELEALSDIQSSNVKTNTVTTETSGADADIAVGYGEELVSRTIDNLDQTFSQDMANLTKPLTEEQKKKMIMTLCAAVQEGKPLFLPISLSSETKEAIMSAHETFKHLEKESEGTDYPKHLEFQFNIYVGLLERNHVMGADDPSEPEIQQKINDDLTTSYNTAVKLELIGNIFMKEIYDRAPKYFQGLNEDQLTNFVRIATSGIEPQGHKLEPEVVTIAKDFHEAITKNPKVKFDQDDLRENIINLIKERIRSESDVKLKWEPKLPIDEDYGKTMQLICNDIFMPNFTPIEIEEPSYEQVWDFIYVAAHGDVEKSELTESQMEAAKRIHVEIAKYKQNPENIYQEICRAVLHNTGVTEENDVLTILKRATVRYNSRLT